MSDAEDKSVRRVEQEPVRAPAENFEGEVMMEAIHADADTGVRHLRVHFHEGATTRWHLHLGDQILYFVDGKGLAQELGGEVIECEPGDIIHVPDGTRHRHGARPGEDAVHIAVSHGATIWDHDPRYAGDAPDA